MAIVLAHPWTGTPGIIHSPEEDWDEVLRDLEAKVSPREEKRKAERKFSEEFYALILRASENLSTAEIFDLIEDEMENIPMMAFRGRRRVVH